MDHKMKYALGTAAVLAALSLAPAAAAQSLTTGYVAGEGWAAGPFFDLTANVPLTVTHFDMYFKGTLNRNVSVYYKAGSYVGSEATAAAWTLIGTVNVTPGGDGTATAVNLGGVSIPAGQTYGFHVWDNLGTGGADGGGLTLDMSPPGHSNAELSLSSNAYSINTNFELYSTGFGWQGTIYYQLDEVPEPVPAAGGLGLILLASLLLAAGSLALRSRLGA